MVCTFKIFSELPRPPLLLRAKPQVLLYKVVRFLCVKLKISVEARVKQLVLYKVVRFFVSPLLTAEPMEISVLDILLMCRSQDYLGLLFCPTSAYTWVVPLLLSLFSINFKIKCGGVLSSTNTFREIANILKDNTTVQLTCLNIYME